MSFLSVSLVIYYHFIKNSIIKRIFMLWIPHQCLQTKNPVVLRFDNVSFSYNDDKKKILEDSSFSIRENTKITVMWQNGAWKSTIFKMITWELQPRTGKIHVNDWKTIAIAKQVIPREHKELTTRDYFATAFDEKRLSVRQKNRWRIESRKPQCSDG